MSRLSKLVSALVAGLMLPSAAMAQQTAVSGQIGLGARMAPVYFGASELGPRPYVIPGVNALRVGPISFGDPDIWDRPEGFGFQGSFRPVRGRSGEDFEELAGLEDTPFSLELGGGFRYSTDVFRVFAVARNGLIGHGEWVGELGADVYFDVGAQTAISVGPRLFYGSDAYAATYFGVTADEAAASAFDTFDAEGGLLSAGFEIQVDHRLNEDWSLRGRLRVNELVGSAGDSPITAQGNSLQTDIGIALVRRFSFGF